MNQYTNPYEHPLAPQRNNLTGDTKTPPYVIEIDNMSELVISNAPSRPGEPYTIHDSPHDMLFNIAVTMVEFALDTLGYEGPTQDTYMGYLHDITIDLANDLHREMLDPFETAAIGTFSISVKELHDWTIARLAEINDKDYARESELLKLITLKSPATTDLAMATLRTGRQSRESPYPLMFIRSVEEAMRQDRASFSEEEYLRLMIAAVDYHSAPRDREQRSKRLAIRLAPDELAMIQALANQSGQDVSDYVRGRLLFHGLFDN